MGERKYFYAIARGHPSGGAPGITTSWGVAQPITSGFPNSRVKGFGTLEKAVRYMLNSGCNTFYFLNGPTDGEKSVSKLDGGKPSSYAVANGREVGQYSEYSLEAEPRVNRYGHACHKSFSSIDAGKSFIEGYKQTWRQIHNKGPVDSSVDGDHGVAGLVDKLYMVSLRD
ncbi:hypothetical protein B0T26DRAFT_302461 [Lasiosphaeria miniovina]|uniref:Ribonuclease H1 N-terminal domain-containing protein n=1 Tax=Lasiosphaeria miniovina TaxID=1954250 RepID=A0AA40AKV3_9PEZI|nr:uncharacterized protein B0T26DRAFT_302461 [Lasiosphaeria miniovina]KAK0717704.1 hypothetical protein B0T26DRAFT_302461 [Lasiosphaeria miniovina]